MYSMNFYIRVVQVDIDLISIEAARVSPDAGELWRQLVERAKSEITKWKD